MVDAAIRMECAQCRNIFPTTEFYDHIISQSECCNMAMTGRHNQYNQHEEFTLCLEEESIINNNPVYESQNFGQTILSL